MLQVIDRSLGGLPQRWILLALGLLTSQPQRLDKVEHVVAHLLGNNLAQHGAQEIYLLTQRRRDARSFGFDVQSLPATH